MSQQSTPMIPVDKIVIEEGFNARKTFDQEKLKQLGSSIASQELVQPISVRPIKGGKYALIAGERRLRAAQLEGIKELPAHISATGNPRTKSLIENIHREDLNDIELAEGLEELAAELKLTTNKAIAKHLDKKEGWVASRRRLLKLPEKVQEAFARGAVPLDAAPLLIKVAAASIRTAECLCEVWERGEYRRFGEDFTDMLYEVSDGEFADPPTLIAPRNIRFSEVFTDPEKLDNAVARFKAATGYGGRDPIIALGEAELTAARAARILLEHEDKAGSYPYSVSFITDRVWAADLALSVIERAEKQQRKREKEAKKQGVPGGKTQADDAPVGSKTEEARARREASEKERAERREAAHSYNDRLGHALRKRRNPENRKKHGLARAKAVAIALVLRDRTLGAAGLRLVMPQLQQAQTRADGSSSPGAVSYAAINEANDFLINRINAAKSVAEVEELVTEAQIAAILADEDALSPGEEAYRHDPAETQVRELLAEEIAAVKVRRSPKQRRLEADENPA